MTCSLDEMLRPNRIALQLLGLWPIAMDSHIRAFASFRLCISFVALVSLFVPQAYSVGCHWGDISYIAETGSLLIPMSLLFFKFIYITWRRRDFARIHRYLERFWLSSDLPIERDSYEVPAKIGRTVSLLAFLACVVDCLALVGLALISNYRRYQSRRLLPFDVSYGFDYESATWSRTFDYLFVGQMINLVYFVSVAIGCDASVLVAVLHMVGQFRLINYRLRMIGEKSKSGFYSNANVSLQKDIVGCIVHHQIVVDTADTLSQLISPMVFGQLLFSGLQMCVSCYAIIEGSAPTPVLIKCCVLLASLIVQLMLWYVPGDFLEEESLAVATSVCHRLPWHSIDNKSLRRDLVFVMLRAQKSCKVVALYQVTNIAKITEVVKAAGSYMALFRSIKH